MKRDKIVYLLASVTAVLLLAGSWRWEHIRLDEEGMHPLDAVAERSKRNDDMKDVSLRHGEHSLLTVGADSKYDPAVEMRLLIPLDPAKVEEAYTEDWNQKDFADKEVGVYVKVSKEGGEAGKWSSTSGESNKNPIAEPDETGKSKWLSTVSSGPEGIDSTYVKAESATLAKVIPDPKYPLFARYVALRDMYSVKATAQDYYDWIKAGSEDRESELRCMAMNKIGDAKESTALIPFCIRALTDPCPDVADSALYPLVEFFDLTDPATGKRFDTGYFFSGPPINLLRMQRGRVSYIAKSIHRQYPAVITEEYMKRILSLENALKDE